MKDNGIEFSAFWGGYIQGNGCWKIMICGGEITKSMKEFIQSILKFGHLGEDSGEQAHHEQARNESRLGAVVNLAKKEITKSQFEAMKNSAMVKEIISELKQKSKIKFKIDGPSRAQYNGTERKQLREEQI